MKNNKEAVMSREEQIKARLHDEYIMWVEDSGEKLRIKDDAEEDIEYLLACNEKLSAEIKNLRTRHLNVAERLNKGVTYWINECGKLSGRMQEIAAERDSAIASVKQSKALLQGLSSHLELCRDMHFIGNCDEDRAVLSSVNAILEEAMAFLSSIKEVHDEKE